MLKSALTAASYVVLLSTLLLPLSGCAPLVAAGIGTGVTIANDRRPAAVVLYDQQIAHKIEQRIYEAFGEEVHVNVTAYNRVILLTGEISQPSIREEITKMAEQTTDVKKVYNETVVAVPSSLGARATDTSLTTKAKAHLLNAEQVSSIHIKVVTERARVYLMGAVTHQEAEEAARLVSEISGVTKVITLFEYID